MIGDARARVREALLRDRLVVVARRLDVKTAPDVARALIDGGLVALEITFENPECADIVRAIRDAVGDQMLVGAGTITTTERFQLARNLDVDFVVAPMFDAEIVDGCLADGRFVVPGALTPSEVHRAWSSGADMIKIFPVERMAPGYVAALREPFGEPIFMGTGGVKLTGLPRLLDAGIDVFGVGEAILDGAAIREARYEVVSANAAEFVATVRSHLEKMATSLGPAAKRVVDYVERTRKGDNECLNSATP